MSTDRRRKHRLGVVPVLIAVLTILAIFENPGPTCRAASDDRAAGPAASPAFEAGILLRLPLPPDVSREDVLQDAESVKERLETHVINRLGQTVVGALQTGAAPERTDRIIVFTDQNGKPILPDLERSRKQGKKGGGLRLLLGISNELTFTFNSPNSPWTCEEVGGIKAQIADFYPLIKKFYGAPAFNLTVNVVKAPSLSSASALYNPTTNTITLGPGYGTQPDVLCHEMIHAFRDDYLLFLNSFEEGMTRAVEVEVFNHLPDYAYWDRAHSYNYDVYYEGIGTQWLGQRGGSFFLGGNTLLYYQLAGYAWAKPFLENPSFFLDFNGELYARLRSGQAIQSDESSLVDVACSVQPMIEDVECLQWYRHQGILNTMPPTGHFLIHQIYHDPEYFYSCHYWRQPSGSISFQPGPLDWAIYDDQEVLLDGGTFLSTNRGVEYGPSMPEGWGTGRIKAVVEASSPTETISDTYFAVPDYRTGIFGVVAHASSGMLTITPLDGASVPVTVPVIDGAFSAPSLKFLRGRFWAEFTDAGGRSFSRQFNKDAGDYFLLMAAADLHVAFSDAAGPVTLGQDLVSTASVTNDGPSAGTGVVFYETLPSKASLLSIAPSQGTCESLLTSGDRQTVVCPLGILHPGDVATVRVAVKPAEEGQLVAQARVVATEFDPDLSGNEVEQRTTISRPSTQEYVGNPGFEGSLIGWNPNAGTLISRVTTGHSGSYAACLRRSSSAGEAQLNDHPNWQLSTTAGSTCTASAWVKGPRGLEVAIRLREYRNGVRVGNQSFTMILPDTKWHNIKTALKVSGNGNAMDLNVYAKKLGVGRELLVDDLSEICN
jgi:hypothetical protein